MKKNLLDDIFLFFPQRNVTSIDGVTHFVAILFSYVFLFLVLFLSLVYVCECVLMVTAFYCSSLLYTFIYFCIIINLYILLCFAIYAIVRVWECCIQFSSGYFSIDFPHWIWLFYPYIIYYTVFITICDIYLWSSCIHSMLTSIIYTRRKCRVPRVDEMLFVDFRFY